MRLCCSLLDLKPCQPGQAFCMLRPGRDWQVYMCDTKGPQGNTERKVGAAQETMGPVQAVSIHSILCHGRIPSRSNGDGASHTAHPAHPALRDRYLE